MEIVLVLCIFGFGILSGVLLFATENWSDIRGTLIGSIVDDLIVVPVGNLCAKVFTPKSETVTPVTSPATASTIAPVAPSAAPLLRTEEMVGPPQA